MDIIPVIIPCIAPLAVYLVWTRGRGFFPAKYGQIGLGLAFLVFALGHFVITQDMIDMLPSWFPARRWIVYATGVLEAMVAIALLSNRWRKLGAVVAVILLVAFFPVNIYAAFNSVGGALVEQHGIGYLWVRAPLQAFLVAWAVWPLVWPDRHTTSPEIQ